MMLRRARQKKKDNGTYPCPVVADVAAHHMYCGISKHEETPTAVSRRVVANVAPCNVDLFPPRRALMVIARRRVYPTTIVRLRRVSHDCGRLHLPRRGRMYSPPPLSCAVLPMTDVDDKWLTLSDPDAYRPPPDPPAEFASSVLDDISVVDSPRAYTAPPLLTNALA